MLPSPLRPGSALRASTLHHADFLVEQALDPHMLLREPGPPTRGLAGLPGAIGRSALPYRGAGWRRLNRQPAHANAARAPAAGALSQPLRPICHDGINGPIEAHAALESGRAAEGLQNTAYHVGNPRSYGEKLRSGTEQRPRLTRFKGW